MKSSETPHDWLDVVQDRLGEQVIPKGRPRKDKLASQFGRKTEGEVFDRPTLLTLYKLLSSNILQTLDYPVSTGKEANVFHATDPKGKSLAVKIFRVHTATFHSYLTYIQGDPRFENLKSDRRNLIHAWVRKEYKNLLRMHDGGVRVPRPVAWADNVLVMEFIGTEGTPAPLLKDWVLATPQTAFEDLAASMERIWNRAGLVHGDLSEYNVMVHGDELTIIDVGQAVMQRHPMAREFLQRDAANVSKYFRKLGVEGTADQLVERVLHGAEAQRAASAGHPEARVDADDPRRVASIAFTEEEQ